MDDCGTIHVLDHSSTALNRQDFVLHPDRNASFRGSNGAKISNCNYLEMKKPICSHTYHIWPIMDHRNHFGPLGSKVIDVALPFSCVTTKYVKVYLPLFGTLI